MPMRPSKFSARQETFTQGSWQNAMEVWQDGKPLWIDRQKITGDQWQSLQASSGQPLLGILVWLGGSVSEEVVTQALVLAPQSEIGWGVTSVAGGVVCRYRGSDLQAV
jgi:urease accessory protein